MDVLKWMKDFLEVTERKTGIFLILIVISFSLYGPVIDGIVRFVLYVVYSYVFSSFIDRKIENRIKKDLKVSERRVVLYGAVYLVSMFVIVLLLR